MRGRKPKPSHLHLVNGNPGKRARKRNEPDPPKGIPDPPMPLSGKKLAAWNHLADKLNEMGVLTVADGWALDRLAANFVEIQEWEAIIETDGRMVDQVMSDGETVRRIPNPACVNHSDAEKRFKAYMCEFGLTPSSRSRVNAKPKEKENQDPAAKYFG